MKNAKTFSKTSFFIIFLGILSLTACKKEKVETPEAEEKEETVSFFSFPDIDSNYPADMEVTSDGGYLILATTSSNGNDIKLLRTDGSGNKLWEKSFGSIFNDYAGGLDVNSNGDILITGTYSFKPESSEIDSTGLFLAKLNSSGTVLWDSVYQYNGSFANNYIQIGTSGTDVKFLSTGGCIVSGTVDSACIKDGLAIELDGNGYRSVYDYRFGTFGEEDQTTSIEVAANGFYSMTTNTQRSNYTPVVVHFKSASGQLGNIISARDNLSYSASSLGVANQIINTSSGFAVIGTTYENSNQAEDMYLMKLDADHNLDGSIKYFGTSTTAEEGQSIITTSDGGFVIAGLTDDQALIGSNGNSKDIYLIKLNSSGVKEWERTYGSTVGEKVFAIQQTQNGYAVLSNMESSGAGNTISVLVLDSEGKR